VAIDTTNEKLALLNLTMPFYPPLPVSPSTLGADDQQQLLWGFPGILWGAGGSTLTFVLDLNTRLRVYLADLYSLPGADLTSLSTRYLRAQTGDYTARFKKLITDATAAMT
jgi:hypothetical protein